MTLPLIQGHSDAREQPLVHKFSMDLDVVWHVGKLLIQSCLISIRERERENPISVVMFKREKNQC